MRFLLIVGCLAAAFGQSPRPIGHPPVNDQWGRMPAGARDIAYDPVRGLLYAGTADGQRRTLSAVPEHPNSILVIDVRVRSLVDVIPCGGSPYRLAISAHGRYLWAAIDRDQTIQRIDLNRRRVEYTFQIAKVLSDVPAPGVAGPFNTRLFQVQAMQAAADDDEAVAIAVYEAPLFVLRGGSRLLGRDSRSSASFRIQTAASGPRSIASRSARTASSGEARRRWPRAAG